MQENSEKCGFLNEEGRCSIHTFRPGLCRLFPLGRNYNDGELKYFLLDNACQKQNHTKIKVKKWLDVPELKQYEKFKQVKAIAIGGSGTAKHTCVWRHRFRKDYAIEHSVSVHSGGREDRDR